MRLAVIPPVMIDAVDVHDIYFIFVNVRELGISSSPFRSYQWCCISRITRLACLFGETHSTSYRGGSFGLKSCQIGTTWDKSGISLAGQNLLKTLYYKQGW